MLYWERKETIVRGTIKLIITEGPEAIVFELVVGMEERKEQIFLALRFI